MIYKKIDGVKIPLTDDEVFSMEESNLLYKEEIRKEQINSISTKCQESIFSGADIVLSDGISHHFSFTSNDQVMISKLADKAKSGESFLPWHADGEECKIYSVEDILSINAAMEELITYHTTYFNSLKRYVESMESISDITSVVYGIPIPDEYKSDVLRLLEGQSNE